MEFEDPSDEEVSPPMCKKRDMSTHAWLQMISMLQVMENDGILKQRLVTTITKRFGVACSTVHQLWKYVTGTHATGVIISLEINSQKEILGGHLYILKSSFRRASRAYC